MKFLYMHTMQMQMFFLMVDLLQVTEGAPRTSTKPQ